MDYRLDLFNAVDRFTEEMTKHDALFVMAFNIKDGDLMTACVGDITFLAATLANDEGWLGMKTEEQQANMDNTRKQVLNMAINILRTDKELFDKFTATMKLLHQK